MGRDKEIPEVQINENQKQDEVLKSQDLHTPEQTLNPSNILRFSIDESLIQKTPNNGLVSHNIVNEEAALQVSDQKEMDHTGSNLEAFV